MKGLSGLGFKRVHQIVVDAFVLFLAWMVSYLIRFEGIPTGPYSIYIRQMVILLPLIIAGRVLCFYLFDVYSIIWRYISIRDAFVIFKATAPMTIVLLGMRFFLPKELALLRIPISVILIEFLLVLLGAGAVRAIRRVAFEENAREKLENGGKGGTKRVLLIGAGDAGNNVLKEFMHRADLGLDVVGFVDDDSWKNGKHLQGFRVLGATSQIPEIAAARGVTEAIITIANASSKDIRRIVGICQSFFKT